jgi:hypothetical protein
MFGIDKARAKLGRAYPDPYYLGSKHHMNRRLHQTGGPPHPNPPLRSADSAEEREFGVRSTFQNPCDEVLGACAQTCLKLGVHRRPCSAPG